MSMLTPSLLVLFVAVTLCTPAAAAPASAPHLRVALSLPSMAQSSIQDLGAVIDIRRIAADGVIVLAVTPGGSAERMGLRRGDRIVSIDGQPLSSTNSPAKVLRSASSSADRPLRLDIVRDGQAMTLQGKAAHDPARPDSAMPQSGCGYVSTSGAHPRATQRIFPAEVTRIDGISTPLFEVNRHRVDTGRRVLIVGERIDEHRFTAYGLQERQRQLRRQGARRYKVLIIDVEPDTRYEIGARLTSNSPDTASIRENTYWEPVVWRSTAEPCG